MKIFKSYSQLNHKNRFKKKFLKQKESKNHEKIESLLLKNEFKILLYSKKDKFSQNFKV